MKNAIFRTLIIASLVLLVSNQAMSAEKKALTISKTYLTDIIDQYLEAMKRGNLDSLPLADSLRVTSNSQVVKVGKGGTWKPGVRIVNRYTFVDPVTRTYIFVGTIAGGWPEHENIRVWWHYALRLSVDKEGNIFEIEEQSNSTGFKTAEKVERPFKEAALFKTVLPEDERVSASELIRAVDSYWDGLTSGEGTDALLGSECQRSEFGVYTTNQTPETWPHNVWYPNIPGSCRYQFDLMEAFHWPTDNRRYYIIDEPRGVIVAIGQLNKFGENGIPGLTLIEAFKVVNGRIDFVWAPAFTFGIEDSGWPDWDRPKR